jgi:WXG100 family type VII secretion target
MASDDLRVMDIDRAGVIRIGERIDSARMEFGRLSKELESQLANMHRDWVGQGGSAFGRLMVEWQSRQSHVTQLLQQFQDSLTLTQKTATEQDDSQASNMFAMSAALNQ